MIIRSMTHSDSLIFEEMSQKYYPEFDGPEFEDNYFNKFTITRNDGELILGGGLRSLAEVIIVTDKEQNKHLIGEALIKALAHCVNGARRNNIDFLHAFVKDESYAKHLIKHGFEIREGTVLSLYVKEVKSGSQRP